MFTRSNLKYFPSGPDFIFKKDVIKGLFSAFPFCKGWNQYCTKGFVQKIITVGSLLCASGWSCTWSVNGDPQECQQPGWTEYYTHKTVCENHHSFWNFPFCRTMFSKVDKVGCDNQELLEEKFSLRKLSLVEKIYHLLFCHVFKCKSLWESLQSTENINDSNNQWKL